MIHIFPRMEYSIDSTKSPEEIYTILKSVTEPRKMVFSRSDNIDFMGEVNPSSFKIIKKNPYLFTITMGNKDVRMYGANSFRPVIRGTIRMKRGLTVIDLKMRMFLFVRIFLTIWYCGVGIPFLAGLLFIIVKDVGGILMLFVSILFFASAQAWSRILFNSSAKNAISKLEELLK